MFLLNLYRANNPTNGGKQVQLIKEKIIENYNQILNEINKYSPYPEKVKILFVSKYFDIANQKSLIEWGFNYFGENKAQVYRDKIKECNLEKVKWDFIGRLQKNKIKYIIANVNLIHSVDTLELLEELNQKALEAKRHLNVLLQINVSEEVSKAGLSIEEFKKNQEEYFKFENITIKGFMTMAPYIGNSNEIEICFSTLFNLLEETKGKYPELEELSMGMSNDYIEALKNGATILRIGSKLFE
jgi:pyridoxal phosphate enzyme (YggS family)